MYRLIALCVFLTVTTTSLCAQDMWLVKKMGEMTTADFYLMEIGSPLTGITIGKKNSGSNDELICFYMTNGEQWNPCPPNITHFAMGDSAFLLGAKYASATELYAIRTEIKGMSGTTALVKLDSNLFNMTVLKMFDNNTDTENGTMEVRGDTLWIGSTNGKIYKSIDGGNSFQTYTVTTDELVQIYFIRFWDDQNGYLAGGATEEGTDSMGQTVTTLLEKGGIWMTTDGGETWTALVENLPYAFIKVRDLTTLDGGDLPGGNWYAMYTDADSYSSSGTVTKHLGFTTDNFATIAEVSPTANTGRKFNGYDVGGIDFLSKKEFWLGGYATDFKACSMVTYDGGATWIEMFLPTQVAEGTNFMWGFKAQKFYDSHHGYAAGSLNTIFKYGDPNEVYEQPDTEQPDESVTDDTTADTIVTDDTTADNGTVTDDTAADTGATDDSDSLIEEEPACGCSIVY